MVQSLVPSCLSLFPQTINFSPHVPFKNYSKTARFKWTWACITRPQIQPMGHKQSTRSRVFVISDLHTEYSENMAWVKSLSRNIHKNDVLLVSGDVSETLNDFSLTMSLLKERFDRVFFVPGNHDVWLRREEDKYVDSLEKLESLLELCRRLGVETKPMVIDGLGIIPLFSWYHESFDTEEDITDIRVPSLAMACKDYHACKWPGELQNGDNSLALYFDAMNDEYSDTVKEIQTKCDQILTFSHFVPRQELCPEKRMLFYPNLPKIIGSDFLETRIRSIHGTVGRASACHVFGHTHFCWDSVLNGIRYVQTPLAYPREQKRRMNGGEGWLPFCIYSEGKFTERLSPCFWGDYYSENPRTPENTTLAPWVAKFYRRLA